MARIPPSAGKHRAYTIALQYSTRSNQKMLSQTLTDNTAWGKVPIDAQLVPMQPYKVQKRRLMWTPFGDHSRMCVGRNFALLETMLLPNSVLNVPNML